MTAQETIQRIQSAQYTSANVAYHFLQPGITRAQLSEGSIVARMENALIGDPLTPNGNLSRFAERLSQELPEVSLFHIEKKTAEALQRQGYTICSLGVEPRVALPFSLRGKDKADLRRALNHSLNAGVAIRELTACDWEKIDPQVRALNQQWLESRKYFKREFRFLARPFVARYQPGERRFVAFKDKRPLGFAVYDPVYRQGAIIGYFETFARCFTSELRGVRDHLTITAMQTFSAEKKNAQWVSLGLSPFAPLKRESNLAPYSATHLALALFYRAGNRMFNCRGLAFHKDRYRGESVPIYFATKAPLPLAELYRVCRLSNIDPLQAVTASLMTFVGKPILALAGTLSLTSLALRSAGSLARYGRR